MTLRTRIFSTSILVLFLLSTTYVLLSPTQSKAQTTNEDILEQIQALSAELADLRSEVQTLRAQVQSSGSSAGTAPVPTTTTVPTYNTVEADVPLLGISLGDSGDDVERLQELLVRFNFNIPAGITGNFFSQTEEALRQLQIERNIAVTGVYDEATRDELKELLDFEYTYSPPEIETTPVPQAPNTSPTGLLPQVRIVAPSGYILVNAGSVIPIVWNTTNAPANTRLVFRLVNSITGAEKLVFETTELSGEYEWTTPSNMPSDNDLIVDLRLGDSNSGTPLATNSAVVAILGGYVDNPDEPTTTTTSTVPGTYTSSDNDFYLASAFTTCMAEHPETISQIHGWIDSGLLRHNFPWGEIQGAAANKVAECESGQFSDGNIPGNTSSNSCTGTTEATCTTEPNCKWYDASTPVVSPTYSCFYANATIDGTPPGYTVWCEESYVNCRVGSSSGESISLEGLVLGESNNCEASTATPDSSASYCYYESNVTSGFSDSLIANVFSALSKVLQTLGTSLGF